jgi:very-short-patch-repair endonuclease
MSMKANKMTQSQLSDMKPLRWPVKHEDHEYMKARQKENLLLAAKNPHEQWMKKLLEPTGLKWTPQARWGYRLFDFWCHKLGIAVEVDGNTHNPDYDAYRDRYNFLRSGVLVLRVRNRNEQDAMKALEIIRTSGSWNERRVEMGLKPVQYGGEYSLPETKLVK